jgi:hypothetical protein
MPATKAFLSAIALRIINPTATVVSTGSYTDLLNKPTTADIVEHTNALYFTNARARAAISFTAGSGAYNNTTGVITIPTNTNQLTNGAGFISGITSSNVTTALGFTPESTSNRGVANGYATLDGTGKVPSAQLPSYVDDVLEYTTLATFPITGTSGIIYVTQDTNKTYRWTGSAYVEISPSPGTTDSLTEGTTNKYYTDTRSRSAISFTAGSGAYNNTTGVITIPTNTNQLTNGAGFISGNQSITITGDAAGVGSTSINLTLTNSGATSGTYGGASSVPVITVDAKGRITSITTTAVSAAVTLTSTQVTNALGYIPVTPAELEDVRALALAGL